MMMRVVEEARTRRAQAIRRILARRGRRRPVSDQAIRAARRALRKWP